MNTTQVPPASSRGTVAIDGPLTVATVARWRGPLAAALADTRGATVDLGGVGEVDAFGLQLLCAGRRSAGVRGGDFQVVNAAESVRRVCADAGLDPAAAGLNAVSSLP